MSSNKLTSKQCQSVAARTSPVKLVDGDGLYLHVAVSGSKVWKLAYRFNEQQRVYTIGAWPEVDLNAARGRRHEIKELLRSGIDPVAHDEQQRQKTIAAQGATLWAVCEDWLEHREGSWAERTGNRARTFLERYVKDGLGRMPIADIDAGMVHTLLTGIAKGTTGKGRKATGAPTTALAVRQMLGEVLQFAIGTARATVNPVHMMRAGLAVQKPKTRHNRALGDIELKRVLDAVACADLLPVTRAAIRLLFLTAVRTGELIAARWSEIDLDAALWTIPASRMKAGETHMVPLSAQAVSVLRELRAMTSGEWLFPNYRDPARHMGQMTINNVLVRAGFNGESWFRGHGVRGSFSTWGNENNFPSDHIEKSLAHVERNAVRLAYNAARWLPQRRALMQAWADHLDRLMPSTVVQEPAKSYGKFATVTA